MSNHRSTLGLPRRVVAWYLFFCLGSVCWLSVGLLNASHAVLHRQTAAATIARLAKVGASVELTLMRQDEGRLESLLRQIRAEGQLTYCRVVDAKGDTLADTAAKGSQIGAPLGEGSLSHQLGVESLQYRNANQQRITELCWPLAASGKPLGKLYVAFSEPGFKQVVATTVAEAPSAVFLPLILIVGGGLMLGRITRAAASIDEQLRGVAVDSADAEPEITKVEARDLASLGWNRLVEGILAAQASKGDCDWESRLAMLASEQDGDALESALQSLTDGIAVTDSHGRLEFANQALSTLLGVDLNQTQTGLVKQLQQHVDVPSQCDPIAVEQLQRPAVAELTCTSGDQQRVLRVARHPSNCGQAQGDVWSLRDITQQKLAEASRDRFLDAATHELRTPLANIKAYAETLATTDSLEVEEQKEFCNTINSEVTRLARFVDDLLSISSMEVGSLTVSKHQVDLQRMFEEVVDKVRPLLAQKTQTLDVQLPERLAEMSLDKDKVMAVLVNLLGNASKYTPRSGHVSLKVKAENEGLRIDVSDTGVGIAEDETERVFEKFFRSADPRVQEETGSGLGLSLAREVVRMHGGELVCESVINEGSTFAITLPNMEGSARDSH